MAYKPAVVAPGPLLSAAARVAAQLERSAIPAHAVPTTAAGSPADAAAGSAAHGLQTRMSGLSAQLSETGPALHSTATVGTVGLQAQDERNAAAVRAAGVGAGFGVRAMDAGTGGMPPLKPGAPPRFPLDLAAIQRLAPGRLGPFGYTELVPGSGVWMPDPSVNALHPGAVRPSAKAPLDLGDIVRRPPGALGPHGYQELVPGSGVWAPDPAAPGGARRPPRFPLDVGSIVRLAPGELGPRGFMELVPGSGVWVPDPAAAH